MSGQSKAVVHSISPFMLMDDGEYTQGPDALSWQELGQMVKTVMNPAPAPKEPVAMPQPSVKGTITTKNSAGTRITTPAVFARRPTQSVGNGPSFNQMLQEYNARRQRLGHIKKPTAPLNNSQASLNFKFDAVEYIEIGSAIPGRVLRFAGQDSDQE